MIERRRQNQPHWPERRRTVHAYEESTTIIDDSSDLFSPIVAVEAVEAIFGGSDTTPEITVPDSSTPDFSFGGGDSGGGGASSDW